MLLPIDVDIRTWLPGDSLADGAVSIPSATPPSTYELQLAILDMHTDAPKVKLAIEGQNGGGWYPLGPIRVEPPI